MLRRWGDIIYANVLFIAIKIKPINSMLRHICDEKGERLIFIYKKGYDTSI